MIALGTKGTSQELLSPPLKLFKLALKPPYFKFVIALGKFVLNKDMFSGTRDKALKPITKLDIEPENCARVTQAIPQEFLSRRECGASRKQNLSIFFAIRNEDKKRKQ